MTHPDLFMSDFFDIETDWIDYNNHLNMGYYPVLFARASDQAFSEFGFGPDYIAQTNHTTFSAEFHVRYLKEVKLGDKVRSSFWIVDYDENRFHTFQELYHEDGWLAATGEGLTLHVSLNGPKPKVAPMPEPIFGRLKAMARANAAMPQPDGVGRKIGIKRKV